MIRAFDRLSNRTRFQRFFRGITRLTDSDLDYLTIVDQHHHVAWCAIDPQTPDEDGLGLGRFIVSETAPHVAEFAFVVIDDLQRQGVGTVLFAQLRLIAATLEISTLQGAVLPDNEAMLAWMRGLGAHLLHEDSLACEFAIPVHGRVPGFPSSPVAVRFEQAQSNLQALWDQALSDPATGGTPT
jgi:GNAT superfamily N-acetyltransferase